METKPVSKDKLLSLKIANDALQELKRQLSDMAVAEQELWEAKQEMFNQLKSLNEATKKAFKEMADDAGVDVTDGRPWRVDYQNQTMYRETSH